MQQRLRDLGWHLHRSALVGRTLGSIAPPGIMFLHHGRCGSSVLARLLGQHPKLRSFSEIFNRHFNAPNESLPSSPLNMLRACRTVAAPTTALVEVKFFECQHLVLFPYTISEFLECTRAAGYTRYLLLDRKNYLNKVVSSAMARARGGRGNYAFAVGQDVPETTIELDVNAVSIQGKTAQITELFEYMDAQNVQLRRHLANENVLDLTFEDDIERDPHAAYAKVCGWLGLEAVPTTVTLTRTRTRSVPETVRNWEAVAAALTGTRYEWMLEQDRAG